MFKNAPKPNIKSLGLKGPEQTPFYVKNTKLGPPSVLANCAKIRLKRTIRKNKVLENNHMNFKY